MQRFNARRIADPIHKTIGLSDVEVHIISTPAYQRLRNVKQLGLAHLVFPGADYSRFSHSLGVCHVTGLILEALSANCPHLNIDTDQIQLYRLAGLLHDIGHYPFSHAMEDAIGNFYAEALVEDLIEGAPGEDRRSAGSGEQQENSQKKNFTDRYFKHERVGKEVLLADKKINRLIREAGFDPKDVYGIFLREKPPRFANLVSSDLDADRIDYLLRTAHHTGLPYGAVDLPYILSQLRVDNEGRICLTQKGFRAADHFLLSRYFDYSQVAYHKTVASLELVLKDVLYGLLDEGVLVCSAEQVHDMIASNQWEQFDDKAALTGIEKLAASTRGAPRKLKAQAILQRTPPKLIWEMEYLAPRDATKSAHFRTIRKILGEKIPGWSARFNVDQSLWYIWDKAGITLTKVGSHVPVTAMFEAGEKDKDRYEQAIRIMERTGGSSREIMGFDQSLMSILSNQALYALRLYVLLEEAGLAKRAEIAKAIADDMEGYL